MSDDVFGETPDVFAEVEADPEADSGGEDPLGGVPEGELDGDNPAEESPAPPEDFLEEPPEPDFEAELPGEEEALAAAEAAEPPPPAADAAVQEPADPLADATPEPEAPPAAPEPAAPAPEPEPAAAPAPAAEPEPAPAAPAAEEAKPKAAKKSTKKSTKKPAKKAEAAPPADSNGGATTARKSERDYVVLYQVEGGTYAVGPTLTTRSTGVAIERAFDQLCKELNVTSFSNMVAVPATNWNPEPVEGETETRHRVKIGK